MVSSQTSRRAGANALARRLRAFVAVTGVACGVMVPAVAPAQTVKSPPLPGSTPWRVVILNDADPTLPAYIALERATRSALNQPGRHPVDVFSETLDLLRFPGAQIEAETVALLARKYAAMNVEAVIALGPSSLDFAERHRAALWSDARIVFQGVPTEWLRDRKLAPTTTGFPLQHDLAGMAELATRLQPDTRRLIVIAGSGDYDRMMTAVARAQLEPFAQRMAVEYWLEQPIDGFLARIAQLDRNDAVLYLSLGRDSDGRTFVPREALKRLSEASRAPVYGPFETYLGYGVVAGTMYSFEDRGRRMGELVHTLLSNPDAPVPAPAAGKSTCMADANQLERFRMTGRLPADCEVRFARPSLWREYRWHLLGTLAVVLGQSALIVALVLQHRRRRRAEDEARRRRGELAQASRLAMAGELTASIAHEINQPLGAILANAGAAETLLRRGAADSGEMREIIADIKQADLRASEIIRRVRALVTTRQVEPEAVDVNSVLAETLAFLSSEAARRGVVIASEFATALPEVLADRVQLQQAIVNLCINAMDAMVEVPAGRRRIDARTAAVADGVEIVVGDCGAGIAPEQLPRLFESFFTTKPQGMGLGLSIVRSIVEAHGGRLAAENRSGGGALFRMVLPAHRQEHIAQERRVDTPPPAPLPAGAVPKGS